MIAKPAAVALAALCLAAPGLAGCSDGTAPAPRRVTVAAAASLRDLLERAAPRFRPPGEPVELVFSFDASSALSRQIEEGAGFDVLVSADEAQVDRLGALVAAGSRRTVLSNRLVMVCREGLAEPPASPQELAERLRRAPRSLRVALAGTAVPAGRYAREMLARAGDGVAEAVEGAAAGAASARAALALVGSGAADCGFVYATDAAAAPGVRVAWTAPDGTAPPIAYVAAVVARSRSPWAEAFVDWLGSEEILREAEALGFLRPRP